MNRAMVCTSRLFRTTQVISLLAVLQFLPISVTPAKLHNNLCEGLQPSTNRAYGDVPEEWYNEESKDTEQYCNDGITDRNGTCGDIIYLESGEYFTFAVHFITKFCSVVVKTGPGTTLKISRTALAVKPCTEEYFYYIADNFQRKLVICGDSLPVELDHAKRLLLQYERRASTDTEFSLTVTAEPSEDYERGRSYGETAVAAHFESYQLCPDECGYDTPALPPPRSAFVRTEAVDGQFPFLVSIFIARKSAPQPERCGGSIINKRHVLTSAYCFRDEDDIDKTYLALGGRDTVPAKEEFTPKHSLKCVHVLGYRSTEQGWRINDLAIVVLGSDIEFSSKLSPVCLSGPVKFDAFTLAVPGYNYPAIDPVTRSVTDALPVDPKKMEVANVFVWPNNECERLYHHRLTDKQTCVYDHLNGTCNGQPGSPAVVMLDDKYYQVAVASHGFPCQVDPLNRYGVFTSVAPYLREIQEKIGTLGNC